MDKIFPAMRWCVYEPLLSQETSLAAQTAFGANARALPKFDRADVVLALDSDFLDCGQGDLASVRAFTSRRRVSVPKDNMNRLYVVENHFTRTGAMADHRLRCPASQIAAFGHALAAKILAETNDARLSGVIGNLQVPAGATKFDDRWLSEAANDLMAKPGASLVLAGSNQPVAVQLLVYAINAALKNLGQTLVVHQVPRNPRAIDILQLAADINDGRIKQLFILGGDPVYNAQRGLVEDRETKLPRDWVDLQKKVPEIVFVGSYAMDDGRYANNGWLQELPNPITKLTWDNAALMSPAFAKKLGVQTGDLVQIAINETRPGRVPIKRELVIAALVSPGHVDNSITIPLGYARKMP